MKNSVKIMTATLTASLVMSGTAFAGLGLFNGANDEGVQPTVSIENAISIAKQTQPNTRVEAAVLEDFNEKPVYFVSLSGKNSDTDVIIDGMNGQVLSTLSLKSANADIHDLVLSELALGFLDEEEVDIDLSDEELEELFAEAERLVDEDDQNHRRKDKR